jgi:hypothetical protein
MTRMEAAWVGWYRTNAVAAEAIADRLIEQAEMTAALEFRAKSWTLYAAAARVLDKAV